MAEIKAVDHDPRFSQRRSWCSDSRQQRTGLIEFDCVELAQGGAVADRDIWHTMHDPPHRRPSRSRTAGLRPARQLWRGAADTRRDEPRSALEQYAFRWKHPNAFLALDSIASRACCVHLNAACSSVMGRGAASRPGLLPLAAGHAVLPPAPRRLTGTSPRHPHPPPCRSHRPRAAKPGTPRGRQSPSPRSGGHRAGPPASPPSAPRRRTSAARWSAPG